MNEVFYKRVDSKTTKFTGTREEACEYLSEERKDGWCVKSMSDVNKEDVVIDCSFKFIKYEKITNKDE